MLMPLGSGTKLGPYEILSSLGAGGMGEVYRARDARLDRTVAIKVLPTSFSADQDRLQRFAQEARAVAALNHPNILSIFDIGEQNSAPYVVCELLEGETLRDCLKRGPLSLRKSIDFALQIARGLSAAHEKGIVHRDLKPDNIFLTSDNRVKILDFGLAKLTRPEASSDSADAPTMQAATEPGVVMGTVGYMSPEQVRGKPADHRSDIFAFGAILYEMLSGKRAFHGETAADTMSAILKEETPELSESARNVPPGLERVVRHCLEKNPAQRFQSAGDLAFGLEALTEVSSTNRSGAQAAVQEVRTTDSRRRLAMIAGAFAVLAAVAAGAWLLGRRGAASAPPEYQQITFRTGFIGNARFAPDGTIVYDALWEGSDQQLYLARTDEPGSRELGLKDATLLAISKKGELAIRLKSIVLGGYARSGTLARMPLSGGSPREILDNVQDADWAPDGEAMAVVRYVPANSHWRLEYPAGKVLLDTVNWISHPKISQDGKWVAFSDHGNPDGDDRGSVAVIGPDGHEKVLSSGWAAIEGIQWSPAGDEIWFSSSNSGSAENLRGVTLKSSLRDIANVPGGMWLQDLRNGFALIVRQQQRIGIRALPPGGKNERDLGWLGWSLLDDLTPDGKRILFTEEADGGGPNYTVFVRDTDGSPPVRISEGIGLAISPDGKWVVTHPANGGALSIVPTGAGESRTLTHDAITYSAARYMPDGKQLLAVGVEAGHGARDYLVDLANGNSKPLTPEGMSGIDLSPDGRNVAAVGPDAHWGVWPLDGAGFRPIPGLDNTYYVADWARDGSSVYAGSTLPNDRAAKIYRVNIQTGKMDLWKSLLPEGQTVSAGGLQFSSDRNAYAYVYSQTLSEAYIARRLK